MFDFLCYESSEKFIPKPSPISYIRIFHATPKLRKVDIYTNGHLISKNLSYRKYTPYLSVPSGQHNINIYPSGMKTNLLMYKNINLEENCIYTAASIGDTFGSELFIIPDPKIAKLEDTARVRFVHLSFDTPSADVILPGGNVLFKDIGYKCVSQYIPLSTGKYNFQVRTTEEYKILLTVPNTILKSGWNYTLFIIGSMEGKPGLQSFTLLDGNTYINL